MVQDGLVYVTDSDGTLHCIDEKTGEPVWRHTMSGQFWASPMVADGKIYALHPQGPVLHSPPPAREKKVLCTVELGEPVSATAMAANGVVYVATMKQLFALEVRK